MSDEELSKFFDDEYNKYSKLFKGAVVKVLKDVGAEVEAMYGITDFCDGSIRVDKYEVLESIERKIKEISGKDCRDCKKWNDCECGKKGHDNGTSIGYSAGECAEYEVTKNDN